MADGDWLLLKGECEKAAESYSTALTLQPENKHCLAGRSKCYLKTGQYEKALRDAEASLQEDQSFFVGLYQKAESLYRMGEFESALVFYHRGSKLRPQVRQFQLGIQKAQEAIENAVTVPADVRQKLKGESLQKEDEMTTTTTEKQNASKMQKKSKKYLGEFYEDRRYLEKLLKDETLVKSRMKNGQQLKDIIRSSLTYLDDCADFWNQQKPTHPLPKDPQQQRKKTPALGTCTLFT
ncbi:outer dynein arm-docking complex subunit 4 [Corythoichthys intestinalis]|uniref:outer dynein arm-docking complex subunit 4 n=1 Tax=Corythoichthys intestinalis TaxID=161448 RepID=UPI0025A4D090|nr:outer dynein arm-docking complex subunit 4 [Corythoichthys intestinalis]